MTSTNFVSNSFFTVIYPWTYHTRHILNISRNKTLTLNLRNQCFKNLPYKCLALLFYIFTCAKGLYDCDVLLWTEILYILTIHHIKNCSFIFHFPISCLHHTTRCWAFIQTNNANLYFQKLTLDKKTDGLWNDAM